MFILMLHIDYSRKELIQKWFELYLSFIIIVAIFPLCPKWIFIIQMNPSLKQDNKSQKNMKTEK